MTHTANTTDVQHFLTIAQTPTEQIRRMLDLAIALRDERAQGITHEPMLVGRTLAMLFEKPSLRTRVSFEQGVMELGGRAIVMGQEVGLGKRETVADAIRVLSGMVHGVAARVFEHHKLDQMADHGSVPIINMLSDLTHPCQAMADALTMIDEFGSDLSGRTVAFIGDGNNVARSLATIAGKLSMNFVLASPPDYALEQEFADRVMADNPQMNLEMTSDALAAVRYADVIYTDTYVSMGQEDERDQRLQAFAGFQVNDELVASAPKHTIVMHDMPAYRGVEITDSVMDGPRSRVIPQAHNRLHAQKGIMAAVLAGR